MREQNLGKRAAELKRTQGDVPQVEAAALRYDNEQENAPKLIGRGSGFAAEKILALAEEHDVPITKDPTLISVLGALDVGAEIPPDLYGVIAEVLAWAYYADKQVSERNDDLAA